MDFMHMMLQGHKNRVPPMPEDSLSIYFVSDQTF